MITTEMGRVKRIDGLPRDIARDWVRDVSAKSPRMNPIAMPTMEKPKRFMAKANSPAPTIVTRQTIALLDPVVEKAKQEDIDPRRLIYIDNEPYLLDLRFRMLNNLELARAMGFTDQESTYEFVGNSSEVTKQIGNAVPVNLAKALVKAILN